MKRTLSLIIAAAFAYGAMAQALYKDTKYHAPIKVEKKWKKYNPGDVEFHDEAPQSEGSPTPLPTFRRTRCACCRHSIGDPRTPTCRA